MLHEFLSANRETLIQRCREKVAKRTPLRGPTDVGLQHGIPLFLEQLVKTLQIEEASSPPESRNVSGPTEPQKTPAPTEIGKTAAKHGKEMLQHGYSVDQVVHDYGDLCQAVTELAIECDAPVTTDEFRTLNRCLDNAIADAVTVFGRQHDNVVPPKKEDHAMGDRLSSIAHELRNLLDCMVVAVAAIRSGSVGTSGATGALLDRSLVNLRDVIDGPLADARLGDGMPVRKERINLADFIATAQVAGQLQAKARGTELVIARVDKDVAVDADRQMLASAVSNLLQNAFEFTRPQSHVSLSAYASGDRVLIEVEDRRGGVPQGAVETHLRPLEEFGPDGGGLGLGLSVTRRSVEANGGTVHVNDLPGVGCIFIIDLPLPSGRPSKRLPGSTSVPDLPAKDQRRWR